MDTAEIQKILDTEGDVAADYLEELLRRYRPWFEQLAVAREGDWVRIDGIRR